MTTTKLRKKHTKNHSKKQSQKQSQQQSIKNPAIQNIQLLENAHKTRLLVMRNRNDTRTASVFFFFKVGSKHESPGVMGISHFIEHMLFKGSPKYPSYLDISKTFDANGISFNAFTAKDMTAYHYKFLATDENMDIICRITSDMIFHPLMRERDISSERNVIIQEMKDDEDDIDEWINDKLEYSIISGHPLANPIIGNLKTLHATGRAELLEYHHTHYRRDNLVIALSGNIRPGYLAMLDKYFSPPQSTSKSKSKKGSNARGFRPISTTMQRPSSLIPYIDKNPRTTVECITKNLQQDYVFIIFKTRGVFDPLVNHYKLLANILGGNMSSRLFIRIREQLGLVYSVKCEITNYEEMGYFAITTQNENKTTLECLRNIFLELDKIKSHEVPAQELAASKKNYCDIFITNFDDIEYENEYYAKQVLFNLPLETGINKIKKIQSITTSEIMETATALFDYSKMHIITFGKVQKHEIEKILIHNTQ
jgi:predicted Zn-dependent peptidase